MKKTKKEIKADDAEEVVDAPATEEETTEEVAEEVAEDAPADDAEKSLEITPESLSNMISKAVKDAQPKETFKRKIFNFVST
jgi:hypothetical protein